MPNAICYYQREQHVLSYFHNRKAPNVAPYHDKRVLRTYADIFGPCPVSECAYQLYGLIRVFAVHQKLVESDINASRLLSSICF